MDAVTENAEGGIMSILIKGMTLPPIDNGRMFIFDDGVAIWYDLDTKVRKEYEVVELPPHGRLIDADALIAAHEQVCSRRMKFNLDLAPTIIEAEGEA